MNNNLKIFNNNIDVYFKIITEELSKTNGISQLGKYVKIQGGYSFKASEYKTTGIPIIRISDFNNGKIILDGVKYYEENSKFNDFLLNYGDIIIAMTGGTIGKLAIVQENLGKIYLNQRVGRFQILEKDKIYSEYLYWIARGVENIVKNMGYGGAQPNISGKQIESIKFVFPKLDIQKNIVNFLNDLKDGKLVNKEYFNNDTEKLILKLHNKSLDIDSIGVKSEQNLSYIKQLKQTILQEAIEGKLTKSWREQNKDVEPASVLLKKIAKEKKELIKAKKIKKQEKLKEIDESEIPFDIPESWKWCRLVEICIKITDGFHHTPVKYDSGFKYISATHVRSSGILWDDCLYVGEKDYLELQKKALPKIGEILITNRGAGCGTSVIIDREDFCFQNVALIGFNQNYISNNYLNYFFIATIQNIIDSFVKGGAQPMLSNITLSTLEIPLPPLSEQKEIVKKVDELMSLCDLLEKQCLETKRNSENLMKSVLSEVLVGKN